ncbi:hypothetical protein D3C73_1319220 [compost metagenome]
MIEELFSSPDCITEALAPAADWMMSEALLKPLTRPNCSWVRVWLTVAEAAAVWVMVERLSSPV